MSPNLLRKLLISLRRFTTTDFAIVEIQVIDIQAALREPDVGREDLADILKDVQAQEKQNLRMVSLLS